MHPHDAEIPICEFRLVRLGDGRQLMVRRMRACDADEYNRRWSERGVPTRWEAIAAPTSAAVA